MNKSLEKMIKDRLSKPIVRYFIIAGWVVVIELLTFVVLNSGLGISYLIATPVSNIVAIALNWYLSIKVVFKGRRHRLHVEASLILFASVVGVGIQLAVAAFCVQILGLAPFIGKVFAIIASFFWSYWIRKRYIFTT